MTSRFAKIDVTCLLTNLFPVPNRYSYTLGTRLPQSVYLGMFVGGQLVAWNKINDNIDSSSVQFSVFYDRQADAKELEPVSYDTLVNLFMSHCCVPNGEVKPTSGAQVPAFSVRSLFFNVSGELPPDTLKRTLLENQAREAATGFNIQAEESPSLSEQDKTSLLSSLRNSIIFVLAGQRVGSSRFDREVLALGCVTLKSLYTKAQHTSQLMVPLRNFGPWFADSCKLNTRLRGSVYVNDISEGQLKAQFAAAERAQRDPYLSRGLESLFPSAISGPEHAWSPKCIHPYLTTYLQTTLAVRLRENGKFQSSDASEIYQLVTDFRIRREKFLQLREAIVRECQLLKDEDGVDTVLALSFPDDLSACAERASGTYASTSLSASFDNDTTQAETRLRHELKSLDYVTPPESKESGEAPSPTQGTQESSKQPFVFTTLNSESENTKELLTVAGKSITTATQKARTYDQGHFTVSLGAGDADALLRMPSAQPRPELPVDPFGPMTRKNQFSRLMHITLDNLEFEFELQSDNNNRIQVDISLPELAPLVPHETSQPKRHSSKGGSEDGSRRSAQTPAAKSIHSITRLAPKTGESYRPTLQQILLGYRHLLWTKRGDISRKLYSTVFKAWCREKEMRSLIPQNQAAVLNEEFDYARKRDMQLLRNRIIELQRSGALDTFSDAGMSEAGRTHAAVTADQSDDIPTSLPGLIRQALGNGYDDDTMSRMSGFSARTGATQGWLPIQPSRSLETRASINHTPTVPPVNEDSDDDGPLSNDVALTNEALKE